MNFFQHQDQARAASRRMLWLFVLAVIVVVAAVDLALIIMLGLIDGRVGRTAANPGAIVVMSLVTLAVIGFSSLFKLAALRGGGGAVARQLGGTQVPAETTNYAWKRLRNVVEEIAIASGTPVPEIFVLENEEGINAFASGYTTADAAVTVTQGALNKLTRDELQGVIAHEFSHVLNGDMRLNIRLMGVVFGILVIGIVGRKILQHGGGRNSRNVSGVLVFGLALFVIGYIGMLCGRVIKASISRSREYLADASAVQFTRQTVGISGALKKIGGLAEGSKLANADTEEVAHMLFGDGVGYTSLLATHPPLIERIRRLEPRFDPSEFVVIARAWTNLVHTTDLDDANASIAGFAPAASTKPHAAMLPASERIPAADVAITLTARGVARQVGNPASDDYTTADAITRTMPESLRAAAYDVQRAIPLALALALDRDTDVRGRQLVEIASFYDAAMRDVLATLGIAVDGLHPMQRLPLASLAFPVLRRKPRPELQRFLIALNQLIQADGRIGLDEYCLAKLISIQVIDALDPSAARASGSRRLPQCRDEISQLFALVARHGHSDAAAAQRAYLQGMNEVLPRVDAPYAPSVDTLALDRALPVLDQLKPAGKELVVRGLVRAISEDGHVTVAEAELLRIVCAAMHCPLPPLLDQG